MCCESFDVVRFDLGPLLQGQMRIVKLKSAYNPLIIFPRVDINAIDKTIGTQERQIHPLEYL